jgi:hypothetical protein
MSRILTCLKNSDDAIDVLVEHANRAISPLSGVVVEYYGGAASRLGSPKLPLRNAKPNTPLPFSRNGRIHGVAAPY